MVESRSEPKKLRMIPKYLKGWLRKVRAISTHKLRGLRKVVKEGAALEELSQIVAKSVSNMKRAKES